VEAVFVGTQIMATTLIQALHAPQDTLGSLRIRRVGAPQANDGMETVQIRFHSATPLFVLSLHFLQNSFCLV